MEFEMINGKIIENPLSNKKKIEANSQEAPIELDDFDYSIPQLPITNNILKFIIGKINVINDKIEFHNPTIHPRPNTTT